MNMEERVHLKFGALKLWLFRVSLIIDQDKLGLQCVILEKSLFTLRV